jgi:hypothetical protein
MSGQPGDRTANCPKCQQAAAPKKGGWKAIGTVCIDSANMILIDAGEVVDGEALVKVPAGRHSQLTNEHGVKYATVVATGYGDGDYTVEARFITDEDWGERIAEIRINFMEPIMLTGPDGTGGS